MGTPNEKIEVRFNGRAEIKWGEIEYASWSGRTLTFSDNGSITGRATGYVWFNNRIKTEEDFHDLWDILEAFAMKQRERNKEKSKDE